MNRQALPKENQNNAKSSLRRRPKSIDERQVLVESVDTKRDSSKTEQALNKNMNETNSRTRVAKAEYEDYEIGGLEEMLSNVEYVPPNIPRRTGRVVMIVFEDNEAVIKTTIKGRSPTMRHITRTHRICMDWIYERLKDDPGLKIMYVGTKQQIADF